MVEAIGGCCSRLVLGPQKEMKHRESLSEKRNTGTGLTGEIGIRIGDNYD